MVLGNTVSELRPMLVIGNHISPFVRKVLAVAALKHVAVRVDPIVPFFGDDRFTALSPLRRVPLLIDGDVILPDSTVIAEYLEDIAPAPSILSGTPADRARSRFLDEFADTRLAQVFLWGVFGKAVVAPGIFKAPRDLDAIAAHMRDDVPGVMDILERNAPVEGFVARDIGLGDISVATHFANVRWARQSIDASRWPRTMAWIERVETHMCLAQVTALGATLVRLPPSQYREATKAAGVAVTDMTFATETPRRSAVSQI